MELRQAAERGVLVRLREHVELVPAVAQAVGRFSVRKPIGAAAGLIIVAAIFVAILAPVVLPIEPKAFNPVHQFALHSRHFLLGTDYLSRDMFSRIVYGARISLQVAFGSVAIGITAGFVLGIVTTYAGGSVDMAFQRLIDAMMSISGLIVALAIMAVLGPSVNNVVFAIVIGMIAPVVRTVRSQVLALKQMDYITAARAVGAPPTRIIFRHLAPNCFAIYLVMATYYLGFAIILEASLSFLGVGAPADDPSWGGMLTRVSEEPETIRRAPWIVIFPGMAIFMVVLGFNLLGDALRDVFDPRLRGSR